MDIGWVESLQSVVETMTGYRLGDLDVLNVLHFMYRNHSFHLPVACMILFKESDGDLFSRPQLHFSSFLSGPNLWGKRG